VKTRSMERVHSRLKHSLAMKMMVLRFESVGIDSADAAEIIAFHLAFG